VGGYLTGVGEWSPEVMDQAVPILEVDDSPTSSGPYTGAPVDLAPYLATVEGIGPAPDSSAAKFAIVCPWLSQHTGGDRSGTYLMQFPSGAAHFECKHEHCQQRKWADFKRKVRPLIRCRVRVSNGPNTIETEVG
jgi:hypothetical protein